MLTDFSSVYSETSESVSPIYLVFAIILCIFALVCMWKIFVKAGAPGWASLIPVYNAYKEFELFWGNGLLFLLMLIPIVDIIVGLMLTWKMCKAFGYGAGMFMLCLFLPIVGYAIIAFGSSTYQGPQ